jgi:hypothetical protein
MIPKILLLDESFDLNRLSSVVRESYYAVVCLFWASPQTMQHLERLTRSRCFFLQNIVGDTEAWERGSYELVKAVCEAGPKYRNLNWRSYLADPFYSECLNVKAGTRTIDFLNELRQKLNVNRLEVDFILSNLNSNIVEKLSCSYEQSRYITFKNNSKCHASPVQQVSRSQLLKRWWRHFQETRMTKHWTARMWDVVEKADRHCKIRCRYWPLYHSASGLSGGVTFFSSYLNNSRIIRSLEDLMPVPVNWVVTNHYAHQGALPSDRPLSWLWQFGNGRRQSLDVEDQSNVGNTNVPAHELLFLKEWLPHSPVWQDWRRVEFPLLANLTGCWEKHLDEVKPRLIVVAHQLGSEGWFTNIAKSRRIPVLQAMHGVFSGYFHTQRPIMSDAMVVPGEFWRDLWPKDERHKIIAYNPVGLITKVKRNRANGKRNLAFFSWPLKKAPFYNFSEFIDEFIHIFHRLLSQEDCRVIVRAHPLENPADFVNRWKHFYGHLPKELIVGKHEPLDQVLAQTDVALMFRSTVMLSCLVNSIPVIMPGWINFGWNQAIRNIPGIDLAKDFSDLEMRLIEWLDRPPEVDKDLAEYFVQSPGVGKGVFCSLVDDLISGRQSKRN